MTAPRLVAAYSLRLKCHCRPLRHRGAKTSRLKRIIYSSLSARDSMSLEHGSVSIIGIKIFRHAARQNSFKCSSCLVIAAVVKIHHRNSPAIWQCHLLLPPQSLSLSFEMKQPASSNAASTAATAGSFIIKSSGKLRALTNNIYHSNFRAAPSIRQY